MKARFSLALMVVAAFLLALSLPVQASKTDDQIISSAKKSYVFKNNLKYDYIKIQSKYGAVTLDGECIRGIPQDIGPRDRGELVRGKKSGQQAGSQGGATRRYELGCVACHASENRSSFP